VIDAHRELFLGVAVGNLFNRAGGRMLLSVSYLALGMALCASEAMAQQTAQQATGNQSGASTLPPVVVNPSQPKKRRAQSATTAGSQGRRSVAARNPAAKPEAKPADTFDARTGTVGYFSNSTSVALKTNTPLLNIPQSINVLTKQFIQDLDPQSITDLTRYVPGVAVHQGEGNRDELVIRGVDSSANFYVNGFRDDVQYFRDLYNAQSVEILKGPSAITFGRASGGGLLNRTLKEADGNRIYEATAQTGSYGDRRFQLDAGQAVNENLAVRLNAFYEGADSFRDFGGLERYGINPTVTMTPNDTTKIKLSYEYFHDERTADRGNPSQAINNTAPASTRFNPATPFAPNGDLTIPFDSPIYNVAHADVSTTMAVIDHDFENGLTVKNSTMYADFKKFYQNVYPGNNTTAAAEVYNTSVTNGLGGAVNPADTSVNLAAYQHTTNRDNLFNQTDFIYKTFTGPIFHTIAFGTEFDHQTGIDLRNTGFFPTTAGGLFNSIAVNPFEPTYFGPVTFMHQPVPNTALGVGSADSASKYGLNIQSGYARDQIDITRWVQLIAGVRYDRFDLTAIDQNTITERKRVDNKLSPQAAVIVKPMDNLSVYGAYSVSYLPASGDQFSSLTNATQNFEPQKFESTEVGVKWNILPRLQYTAAIYHLNRTNVPVTNPDGSSNPIPAGNQEINGFETGLNGYVTNDWQATLGYAYTDARVTSRSSPTIVEGNRVQLVPYNQVSLWNKYQFDPSWAAALGVIYFSDSYAASDDTVKLPGFVRFDAAVYYKINEQWRAQFNVENVFNKGYWASADGNNNISPGAPRTFRVSATAKF
jgi:catecholate siderophore receptor